MGKQGMKLSCIHVLAVVYYKVPPNQIVTIYTIFCQFYIILKNFRTQT